jgi:hypothetical protein
LRLIEPTGPAPYLDGPYRQKARSTDNPEAAGLPGVLCMENPTCLVR